MKTLEPIGIEKQIEDTLSGIVRDFSDKKNEIKKNIDKVKKINGKKVYNVIMDGDYLHYNLKPRNDGELIYYYPVQYANIEFE
jgi:hypothetical protein